jgi:methylated-DNA-[protein]-cysteine S-methyltransferase
MRPLSYGCPHVCSDETAQSRSVRFSWDLISRFLSGAAQAVGNAMATNPLQILVPCHRVIHSDGSLGQYARGKKNSVKNWLLEHEGLRVFNNKVAT